MHTATALIFSWLNILTKKRYDALKEQFGSLDEALLHIDYDMLAKLGCKEETIFRVMNRMEELDPDAYAQELARRSITLISIEDDAYPQALRQIPDPPVFLCCKGSLDILNQPCIGCVGKRDMSPYGSRVVSEFIPAFVAGGVITVSGLAKGIDAEVAKETIRAGGKTVAVVGHGLADIYPSSNKELAKQILRTGGLILSEFPLDVSPDKFTFPARNRIIAALSLGTVVFEAGEKSGACITAELALEYGRDVFAIPGQVFDEHYAGCNHLIANGHAKLAVSAAGVLRDIGLVISEDMSTTFSSEDPEEQKIYDALTGMPQSASDLMEKAMLDAAVINAKLTMLELGGAAKNVGNGMWVKN